MKEKNIRRDSQGRRSHDTPPSAYLLWQKFRLNAAFCWFLQMKSILKFDLHQKRFRVVANERGMSNELTTFEDGAKDDLVLGSYHGGPILMGQIIGMACNDDTLDLRFQSVALGGELKSGWSRATVSMKLDSQLVMSFECSWLLSDHGTCSYSTHVEVQ